LQAISFKVPDIEEAIAELERRGIKLRSRFEFPLIREAVFQTAELHGLNVELCQYEMGHPLAFAAAGKSVI
jgi:hypothetical protein